MAKFTYKAKRHTETLPFLASIAFIILIWQLQYLIVASDIILPSPFGVAKKLISLIISTQFLTALGSTAVRLLFGLLISLPLGIIAGLICGVNKTAHAFFKPFFTIIAATPVMSVVLIAYLAFGSERTPVFTAFLMVFPVMAANAIAGVEAIDPKYRELCAVYKLNRLQRLQHLYLPFILPFLAGGIRSALSLAWKVIVAAEVLVQPLHALGSGMQIAKANLETTELFAWTCCTVIAAALSEMLLNIILRIFKRPA
ncbi:MAG: ABC transporter permease subunit [Termitinemataceae bacterium]|nr:MAG: ABC transporter permease subunit [Termitinemataceae bacterium]